MPDLCYITRELNQEHVNCSISWHAKNEYKSESLLETHLSRWVNIWLLINGNPGADPHIKY